MSTSNWEKKKNPQKLLGIMSDLQELEIMILKTKMRDRIRRTPWARWSLRLVEFNIWAWHPILCSSLIRLLRRQYFLFCEFVFLPRGFGKLITVLKISSQPEAAFDHVDNLYIKLLFLFYSIIIFEEGGILYGLFFIFQQTFLNFPSQYM